MRLNINATGANAVPFQEGVSETQDTGRLVVVVYLPGDSYGASQLDDFLKRLTAEPQYEWLRRSGDLWALDSSMLRETFSELRSIPWFKGQLVTGYDAQFGSLRGSMGNFDSGGHGLAVVGHHRLTALIFALDAEVAADSNNVFYSWMSDRDNFSNRGFIQDCLEKAVKQIGEDPSIGITPALDRDTKGKSGSPDIADTIFRKIARARAFVADVTLMVPPVTGWRHLLMQLMRVGPLRLSPNPNVLVELGFAAGQIGWDRCLLVVNTAFGAAEQLPFDLRGRRIIPYRVASKGDRETARTTLIPLLKSHLIDAMKLKGTT